MRLALLAVLAAVGLCTRMPLWADSGSEAPDRPLSLDECIAIALARSPSVSRAEQQVRSSEAALKGSISSYYPSAVLVGTRGRTGGTSFLDTSAGTVPFSIATERREAEVVLSQTIWQSGRRETVRSSRHLLAASVAGQNATRQEVVVSVSQLYYAALAAEELVAVAKANLTAAQQHERLVRARSEVGESPPVDVIYAEADVAQAEFSVLQSENDAGLAKARLKSEMGVAPTHRLQLVRAEVGAGETPPSLEGALAVAGAHRPELAEAEASVQAAREQLRVAKLLEWGQLSLSAEYDRGVTGPKADANSWAIVGTVTAFLFDGGGRAAQVEAAQAQVGSAEAQQRGVTYAVGLEVESALLDLVTASRSIGAAKRAVASTEAQLAAAQSKYREGVGIFVEILDAEKAVVQARTDLVRATFDYATAQVALRRATGTLALPGGEGLT
ncbi:MAG: TolC family protein [Armatimonadota bacterium]